MEETTSWKNHSFTLLIFGGIIVLCSIFFTLGMVVGRSQGRHLASLAFEAEAAKKPVATTTENFPLDYYSATTSEKQDPFTLQPAPEPPAQKREAPPVVADSQEPARPQTPPEKKQAAPPPPASAGANFLQISAAKTQKQADEELKKVQSKGFKGKILKGTKDNVTVFRVVVGPYKDSEVSLAKKDLQAKGYKDAFLAK
jgi:cell division septation protein DedD